MEQVCEQNLCTGCSACMNICPHSAITMQESAGAGYIYPVIDKDKCVNCHHCVKVCPVNYPPKFSEPKSAFAVATKDSTELMSCASGGASTLLAKSIILRGGVVYGCVQRNYLDIAHRRIVTIDELSQMKGSKYVQSSIGNCYQQVKEDLKQGLQVLFTGTPCQIAGLRNFLRKDYANLYLIDLVCHGVPSQKLLRDDISHLYSGVGTPPADLIVSFRHKKGRGITFGTFFENYSLPNMKHKFPVNNYITAFMSGITFRKNCFSCPYARPSRISDVTLADFWGYKGKALNAVNGISLAMPSTDKGIYLVDLIKEYAEWEERPVQEAILGNGQLQAPSKEPSVRDKFHMMYVTNPQEAYTVCLKEYRREWKKRLLLQSVFFQWKPLRLLIATIVKIKNILKS